MVGLSRSECHQVAGVLQRYLDGEVAAPTESMVAAHPETCRRCGAGAATQLAIKTSIVSAAPHELAADAEAVARLPRFADEPSAPGD